MNLKNLNESFSKKYSDISHKQPLVESFQEDLRNDLTTVADELSTAGDMNIKSYEIAFQDAIEKNAPDKSWWEVTTLNIFWDLFENRDVYGCIDRIIDGLAPEFKDEELEEFLDANINLDASGQSVGLLGGTGGKVINSSLDLDDDEQEKSKHNKNVQSYNGYDIVFANNGECSVVDGKGKHLKGNLSSEEEAIEFIDSLDESLKEDIKVYRESDLTDFEFWSGAKDTVKYLTDDDLRQICNILEEAYPDGMTETQINDIFWFEDDWIAELLGYGSFEELVEERDASVDEDLLVRGEDGKLTTTYDSGRWGNSKEWNWNNESLKESLEEVMNRLNESEISPEDKADSDLIRSMLAKMEKRSNAKFSPEEQAVLDKYGIKRSNFNKNLFVGNTPLDDAEVDGKQAGWTRNKSSIPGHSSFGHSYRYNNGDKSKINYADRARKIPQRQDNQVTDDGSGWGYNSRNNAINSHTRRWMSDTTLQTAERGAQERKMRKPMDDMRYALDRRNAAQGRMDRAEAESSERRAKAKAEYEKALERDAMWYKSDTVDSRNTRDRAQKDIDKMLRRDKNESKQLEESPSYEMSPQYDARKSFYGKARVDDEGDTKTLYSYNTPVARISGGNVELLDLWDSSQTTLRHVKEFLRQNGFEASSLAQLRKDYM